MHEIARRYESAAGLGGVSREGWNRSGSLVNRRDVNAADEAIMKFAKEHDFTLLTHDLDFGAILAATHGNKPSVVVIRGDNVTPGAIGNKVLEALDRAEQELKAGALLSVDILRARLRLLPLHESR